MTTRERSALKSLRTAGLLLALPAAVLTGGWLAVGLTLVTIALAAWENPAALRPIVNWRWGLLLALLIAPSALFVGQPDLAIAGLRLSREGLRLGVEMACRATTVITVVSVFSQSISVMQLTRLLDRYGLRGLGFAIGVGFHAMPTLKQRFLAAYAALRLRGGFRRQRWRAVQLLLITVISGALRYGEEVVLAAEARAFETETAEAIHE